MAKKCDNKSVGLIIKDKDGRFLLNQRLKFPPGWAPPAGHLDGDTFDGSVVRETKEEVGLDVLNYKLVLDRKFDNHCSRDGGSWHHWQVYEAVEWEGDIKLAEGEIKNKKPLWVSEGELKRLVERTIAYLLGSISESDWEANPGLEIVWYEIFKILEII